MFTFSILNQCFCYNFVGIFLYCNIQLFQKRLSILKPKEPAGFKQHRRVARIFRGGGGGGAY